VTAGDEVLLFPAASNFLHMVLVLMATSTLLAGLNLETVRVVKPTHIQGEVVVFFFVSSSILMVAIRHDVLFLLRTRYQS
jgi:hypothetical protein